MRFAHQDENEVRRAYNEAKSWPERVQLMQAWADMLMNFGDAITVTGLSPLQTPSLTQCR